MVFEEIAKKKSENGVSRTAKQCRIKLKALKTDYKKIIDHNNRSGRERRTLKFFEDMDRVLRDNPSCHPAFVFDSSSEIDVTGEDVSSPESDMENPNEESTVEVCSPGCSVSAATSGETVDQGSRNPTARHAGRTKKRKLDQMRSLMDEWGQRFISASSKEFEELMRREQLRDEEE
nr:zinc finger and SCAN domain-containing protein 29-like isoform X2 [Misgurnus anguillicaudatus]